MGKFKEKNGKTFIGTVLSQVSKAVPGVLDLVGDFTGIDALDKVSDVIRGKTELSTDDKEILLAKLEDAKQLELARLADMDSARDMQKTALTQEDLFSKRFIYYLAVLWSVAAIGFIFTVMFIDIPVTSTHLVDTILGFMLGTIISGIINFFFGSSSSSDKKTDVITSLSNRLK